MHTGFLGETEQSMRKTAGPRTLPAKIDKSGNDFQSAGPHVRQLHLTVEILNNLSNQLGLTIQINNSFLSNYFTKIVLIVQKKSTQAAILDFLSLKLGYHQVPQLTVEYFYRITSLCFSAGQ